MSFEDELCEALDQRQGRTPEAPLAKQCALLDEAKAIIAERGLSYDGKEDNFPRIARLWSAHLTNKFCIEIEIDALDVAVMMILLKVARGNTKDSYVDILGYGAHAGVIHAAQTDN